AKPHQDRGQRLLRKIRWSPAKSECNSETEKSNDEARNWTNNSHPELGLGVSRFLFDLRDATKREERDRSHGQTARFSDNSVRKLVRDDRDEEQHRGHER